ncbi:hypothetical protein [Jidongwangia harbinensis]|uniref:hypothetical protein n=1 Tax=Jidongwangia harbinensis TaxID=2878561 RepID=UPI001CD96FB3|nr:hypothetical protein [Jidongwangia harbinensis]MCA2219408.1 hypothetical protein [Jidongwangia harbinensis]
MRTTHHGLHIGADAEKVVVAPYPLTMRTGRARRRRTGSVTELLPVPPSGRTRPQRIRLAAQLTLPLMLLCAVLDAVGVPWWAPAAGTVALVGWVVRAQARAARVPSIALPPGDDCHVLVARAERTAYQQALVLSRRVRRTWPALGDLIDPADADRTLTRALDELAALMARRQQIRRLRADLAGVDHAALPADSAAVLALDAQRHRVDALWRETGGAANRMLAGLTTAALAGENLIREQRVHRTAREAELAISRLAVAGPRPVVPAAPELAERTAAVIAAYRDLATWE